MDEILRVVLQKFLLLSVNRALFPDVNPAVPRHDLAGNRFQAFWAQARGVFQKVV
jgi:hypothetical protein